MILLQARTTSTRLPAKALLPVAGLPAVVVCARRAANTGHEVVVATSALPSDDLLAAILADHGVSCYRGELDNVLKRFVDATADLADEEIVVRLTADNLFPDGAFLDRMIDEYEHECLDYLMSGLPECGLPYGMAVEVMRARHLREALAATSAAEDLEHVTPWIRRAYGARAYLGLTGFGMERYRCTIDTLDDYLKIAGLFRSVRDPIAVPHAELLTLLAGLPA